MTKYCVMMFIFLTLLVATQSGMPNSVAGAETYTCVQRCRGDLEASQMVCRRMSGNTNRTPDQDATCSLRANKLFRKCLSRCK
jgi:hypothetical protein